MTKEDVIDFMREHPGEMLPVGFGWIDPQAAIDLLSEEPMELIDILKGCGTDVPKDSVITRVDFKI